MRFLAALFAAAVALAGCATPSDPAADAEAEPIGAFSIAREHDIDATKVDVSGINEPEDLERLARSLGETTLVVRVAKSGSYALEYVDRDGYARTDRLLDMKPGEPARVTAVDPLGAARLRALDAAGVPGEVVYERPTVDTEWWNVGGIPLGLRMAEGARAEYAYEMAARAEMELRDIIPIPEQGDSFNGTIERATFRLDMPTSGALTWDLRDGVFDVRIEAGLDAPEADLARLEIVGTDESGERGEMAVYLPSFDASAEIGFSLVVEDGGIRSARFDGARASGGGATLLGWSEGPLGRDNAEEMCPDGATRADPCVLWSGGEYDESVPAGDEYPAPVTPTDAETIEEIEASVAPVLRFLAQDLVVGDSFRLHGATELPATPQSPEADASFELVLAVADAERIETRAGAFDALRVTQTLRVALDVAGSEGSPMPEGLAFDETVSRTTMWLDATRYVPLRVEVESPVDVDAFVHQIMAAVDPAAWEATGAAYPAPDSYRILASGRSAVEAERLEGDARFSPTVGLALAGALAQGAVPLGGFAALGATLDPFGSSGSSSAPSAPARYLSLMSAGPLAESEKRYTIASATPGMTWSDVLVSIDGVERAPAWSFDCSDVIGTGAAVCGGEPGEAAWRIDAGDQLALHRVSAGQVARVIDVTSGSVMLTLVVG